MIPTREQELPVLRSVDLRVALRLSARTGAARIEPDWHRRRRRDDRALVARERSAAGDDRVPRRTRISRGALRSRAHPVAPRSPEPRSCSIAIGASCRFVANMPFVRMVALSGSLAHLNAEGSADLDLFVITAPNRVWSVTVATVVLSKLLGWRKRLCMNYVVSERRWRSSRRICFRRTRSFTCGRSSGIDVFERFVKSNAFVRRSYPNFESPEARKTRRPKTQALTRARALARLRPARRRRRAMVIRLASEAPRCEWQSSDQVRLEPECLKLHTSSHRASTLAKFDAAMAEILAREPVTAAVARR